MNIPQFAWISGRARYNALWSALLLVQACATTRSSQTAQTTRWPLPASIADTIYSDRLAPGVFVHHLVRNSGPQRVHVIDIDRAACVSLRAVKGAAIAVGRTTPSDLLRSVPAADIPLAAVNADFFLFTPPGVPVGAFVSEGRVFSGPVARPVFALDAMSNPSIATLTVHGTITSSRNTLPLTTWNRPTSTALGVVDNAWGQPLDSVSRSSAMMLVPLPNNRYRIAVLPASHTGQAFADTMMLVGSARASLVEGDTVRIDVALLPGTPYNAVGGFPLLVRDSVIVPSVDTDGAAGFRGVNPRTAVGYADNGRRVLLVVFDGRQPGVSVGTTTRETAAFMRDLGASEALNLDGGGSTALVVRDVVTGQVRVVNKPSDAAGERRVGNALVVLGVCDSAH